MSKKSFKILFYFGMKNFEFNVFSERGNDIWYKQFVSQSFQTQKAYFEVYKQAIIYTYNINSLTHWPITHNSLTDLTHKTGILTQPNKLFSGN